MTVNEKAYAKINLFLNVTGRRSDGFHDIVSVMQTIGLSDTVTVTAVPSEKTDIRLVVSGDDRIPTDSRNIAYRAAESFLAEAGQTADVEIALEKRIPSAAGLAGGSADAAAVIRALQAIYKKTNFQKNEYKIAAEIGSDVPFCLGHGAALCEGRGEILHPVDAVFDVPLVVACADESVSTPWAYTALDGMYGDFSQAKETGDKALSALLSWGGKKDVPPPALFNIFERVVLPVCPGAQDIKRTLSASGASCVLMSGSGPSVFGIFDTDHAAASAARKLVGAGIRAWSVRTVG